MRRFGVVVALVLSAGLLGRADAGTGPTLRLIGLRPLEIRGTHFHAREHVRVSVRADGVSRKKRIRATRLGRFVVTFSKPAAYDPCNGDLTVAAVGAGGSRAALKVFPRDCPPAD